MNAAGAPLSMVRLKIHAVPTAARMPNAYIESMIPPRVAALKEAKNVLISSE